MAGLPDPVELGLEGEAAALYKELVASRGRIDGMYRTMLHHPQLTRKVGALGAFFRFGESVLPDDVRELVILHVAARLRAGYEWLKHVPPAIKAGLSNDLIAAVKSCDSAPLAPEQRDLVQAADMALELRSLPGELQERIVAAHGREGVLELVALVGFYRMIAGVIACFDVELPPLEEGENPPFEE